jgi:hypothetical protein
MSSAFCNVQRVANVVGYLVIVSLYFIHCQFVKFSNIKIFYQVPNFAQICNSFLLKFSVCRLGFKTEFVVMYVDVVHPSVTSSSCLNSGRCHCGPFR